MSLGWIEKIRVISSFFKSYFLNFFRAPLSNTLNDSTYQSVYLGRFLDSLTSVPTLFSIFSIEKNSLRRSARFSKTTCSQTKCGLGHLHIYIGIIVFCCICLFNKVFLTLIFGVFLSQESF